MDNAQYSEKVMEHFRNPHNVGEIPDASGVGNVGNPVCILPDTLINSNPSISEIKNIKKGSCVLSHDGKYHKVSRIFRRYYRNPITSIAVHNLGSISTTRDHHILASKTSGFTHKFYQYKGCIPDWYMADELHKGDMILYPIPKEEKEIYKIRLDVPKLKYDFKSKSLPEDIPITEDFLRLVGYYLAEGFVRTDKCKGTLGFVFGATETRFVDECISVIKNIFGLDVRNKRIIRKSEARLSTSIDR